MRGRGRGAPSRIKPTAVSRGGSGANVVVNQTIAVVGRLTDVRVCDPWTLLSVSDPRSYEKDVILPNVDFSWLSAYPDIKVPGEEDDGEVPPEVIDSPFEFSLAGP
jgi:hypothetical protein